MRHFFLASLNPELLGHLNFCHIYVMTCSSMSFSRPIAIHVIIDTGETPWRYVSRWSRSFSLISRRSRASIESRLLACATVTMLTCLSSYMYTYIWKRYIFRASIREHYRRPRSAGNRDVLHNTRRRRSPLVSILYLVQPIPARVYFPDDDVATTRCDRIFRADPARDPSSEQRDHLVLSIFLCCLKISRYLSSLNFFSYHKREKKIMIKI